MDTELKGDIVSQQANVSSQVYGGLAGVLRVVVLGAILLGVVLLVRIIYLFFGVLKTAPAYDAILAFTEPMVAPLGALAPIKTPYDGIFDVAGTAALLAVMVIEFILSSIKSSLAKKSEQTLIGQITAQARAREIAAEEEEPALKK